MHPGLPALAKMHDFIHREDVLPEAVQVGGWEGLCVKG
jgi:hypothetical protein